MGVHTFLERTIRKGRSAFFCCSASAQAMRFTCPPSSSANLIQQTTFQLEAHPPNAIAAWYQKQKVAKL
ncbi:expressed unknown protein [Ectocarpus siliculosus]|uniref:Uncharacterized protein n=1 Tax=Ectocarpus siliculosus TaxID=2880 RepID=D7FX22_ECTSI|nr:expressed unknown protein [Ectocarpus siliculosus]|eukprot:CBJ26355.1 expressed unknown protein [Ectocarpus siliculosus]